MEKIFTKVERFIGSMKFAVIIILIFSTCMITGTFLESFYGTEFAGRMLYKTWPFMGLQFFMFLSILAATFLRLPPKKRLYGFYVIHAGLIIIGIGSAVTYIAGIDGSLALPPNEASREVILSDDVVRIEFRDDGRRVTLPLPNAALQTNFNQDFEEFSFKRFYPYATAQREWKTSSRPFPDNYDRSSSNYRIKNANVSEEFVLTHHPDAQDFRATLSLGPLSVHYLPAGLATCFSNQQNTSGFILWNSDEGKCFIPEEMNIKIARTESGKPFFAMNTQEGILSFFPNQAPWPVDEKLNPLKDSAYKVFNKKIFEEKPNLFLFGRSAAFFEKDSGRWVVKDLTINNPSPLPWMGFELTLLRFETELYPANIPYPVLPVQKNSELVIGGLRAIELSVRGQNYWLTNEKPLTLSIDGKTISLFLEKKSLKLPFEFVLSRFKMDTDPGTNRPASYESFVTLFTSNGPKNAHIFMNNPLKHQGFTFYQASYWQDPQTGEYGSTLSVNVDQGRPLKYLGSILLVLGSIWHFGLNRKDRFKKNKDLLELKDSP